MALEKTWRWFGDRDPIRLSDIGQIGVDGIVTSLHDVAPGAIWKPADIDAQKHQIESSGFRWSVVESLPVAEDIKTHSPTYDELVNAYRVSLENLGNAGIDTVVFNFMPVLDWARTNLHHPLSHGTEVMLFDWPTFAAFDLWILGRPRAERDYPESVLEAAEQVFAGLSKAEADELAYSIIIRTQSFIHGSVPQTVEDYRGHFLELLSRYDDIDANSLRRNLRTFLEDVTPVAEKAGIRFAVHPDDPPFPLLGLPRIVSTAEDLREIFSGMPSPTVGLTFCTGSLSASKANHVPAIFDEFADRVQFIHLRSNKVLEDGSFRETGHLDGEVQLPAIVLRALREQARRMDAGRPDTRMPVRPDHGIRMLDDFTRDSPPGYPLIGRLKGISEICGVEDGISYMLYG